MKSKALCAVVMMACGGALAGEPVSLKCPAGSEQKVVAGQDVHCVQDGRLVAGPVVMLYPSGKKMAEGQTVGAGHFRTGTWTLYDEQGVRTHIIQFDRGDFHGTWTELHPNGRAKTVIHYDRGAKVGAAETYDPTGKLVTAVSAK